MSLKIMDHPLIKHKMTILRKKETSSMEFRQITTEIATLMGYEVTRDLELRDIDIETPLEKTVGQEISGKKISIVPILRAGIGMVDGLLTIVPSARVGHIGMYRDPETLKPVTYYCKLPKDIENRLVILLDPMLSLYSRLSIQWMTLLPPVASSPVSYRPPKEHLLCRFQCFERRHFDWRCCCLSILRPRKPDSYIQEGWQ